VESIVESIVEVNCGAETLELSRHRCDAIPDPLEIPLCKVPVLARRLDLNIRVAHGLSGGGLFCSGSCGAVLLSVLLMLHLLCVVDRRLTRLCRA